MASVESPSDKFDTDRAEGAALEEMRTPLVGFFRRRVSQQDEIADLVQEVYLRIANRGALVEIENLRGYVFRVAESVLHDRHRRQVARHANAHVVFDPEVDGETEPGPDRILAGKDALNIALQALNEMPERMRTIFVLRRLEGMRYRDIAVRLKVSVSAVEKDMVRAVAYLAGIGDSL